MGAILRTGLSPSPSARDPPDEVQAHYFGPPKPPSARSPVSSPVQPQILPWLDPRFGWSVLLSHLWAAVPSPGMFFRTCPPGNPYLSLITEPGERDCSYLSPAAPLPAPHSWVPPQETDRSIGATGGPCSEPWQVRMLWGLLGTHLRGLPEKLEVTSLPTDLFK